MSLNQLLTGTPASKQWCNISVDDIKANPAIFLEDLKVITINAENVGANNITANHSLTVNNDGQPLNLATFLCETKMDQDLKVLDKFTETSNLNVNNNAFVQHKLTVQATGLETSEFKGKVYISQPGGGLFLPTSIGIPSLLDFYQKETLNLGYSGAISGNTIILASRIGNKVTLSCDGSSNQVAAADIITISLLPAIYRPTIAKQFYITVVNNGAFTLGNLGIDGFGNLFITGGLSITTNFTGGQPAEFRRFSISYVI